MTIFQILLYSPLSPALGRQRPVALYELEANLVYRETPSLKQTSKKTKVFLHSNCVLKAFWIQERERQRKKREREREGGETLEMSAFSSIGFPALQCVIQINILRNSSPIL